MKNKLCHSYNSFLRDLPLQEKHYPKSMTWVLQSVPELELALQAILRYERHTTSGEAKLKCLTEIKLSLDVSREMSL